MHINEATKFFHNLLSKAVHKSEIKIYENFIGILFDLENRDLTKEQIQTLETKLEKLALITYPGIKKKYFKQKLASFKKFLQEELSLISEGYYAAIGISLGISVGLVLGNIFEEIGTSTGISLGIIIGLIIGRIMDSKAKKQDRVLMMNLN